MSATKFVITFIIFVLVILGTNSLFIVNEMQRAVLLEFGAVKRADIGPGLHLKWPFINDVRKFDGRPRMHHLKDFLLWRKRRLSSIPLQNIG